MRDAVLGIICPLIDRFAINCPVTHPYRASSILGTFNVLLRLRRDPSLGLNLERFFRMREIVVWCGGLESSKH